MIGRVRNCYAILSLDRRASFDQIHRAYRTLALEHHPDRNPIPGVERSMAAINEAYLVLSDPDRRAAYDRSTTRMGMEGLDATILGAARDVLLREGWRLAAESGEQLVLALGPRRALVRLVAVLGAREIGEWIEATRCASASRPLNVSAVLALEVPFPERAAAGALPQSTVVVDLVHSKHFPGGRMEPDCAALFHPFVGCG